MNGDCDLAAVAALLADPKRSAMLLALGDGRSLPAGRLADEAGISAATGSSHLRKLTEAGLLAVEKHGRNRYYRLSGPDVGRAIESLQRLAPAQPIRSLKDGTRAHALRQGRTCYDHLAGRLGVRLMAAWLDRGLLTGGDGRFRAGHGDSPSSWGHDLDYRLTAAGADFVADFGIDPPADRRLIRYCVDWTEERHHLAGALGRGLLDRLLALGWITRAESSRAVRVTADGERGLSRTFGI